MKGRHKQAIYSFDDEAVQQIAPTNLSRTFSLAPPPLRNSYHVFAYTIYLE